MTRPAASAFFLSAAMLLASGCHRSVNNQGGGVPGDQPLTTQQNARKSFNAALAETCGAKHLENLSPDDLHTQIQAFYMTLDSPEREQYGRALLKSCGATPSTECYNNAVLQAAVQDGKIQPLAIHVCQSR